MCLPWGKAAALFASAIALTGCVGGQTETHAAAVRFSSVVGQSVTCSATGDLGIWAEYDANTPLYSCIGEHRRWCVVEPPEPFRDLFRLRAVADVTGGMFALFYRDAWPDRPSCLRWDGVTSLASVGG